MKAGTFRQYSHRSSHSESPVSHAESAEGAQRARGLGAGLGPGLFLIGLCLGAVACDEEKPVPAKIEEKKAEPAPEEAPVVSPPHFVIHTDGISVRGTSVEGGKKSGIIAAPELAQFKRYLDDEKKFIEGQDLTVIVDRHARRGWVGAYLTALGEYGAAKVTIKTETREGYPGEVEFVVPTKGSEVPACSLIGQVTEHNGSALWAVQGGTAKARGPGLGGPDLSMAQEEIAAVYAKCESDIFVTDGAETKEWGFIYDMAAAAIVTPEAGVKRAFLAEKPQTAGRKASL